MTTELVTRTVERLKSGINYVCSECGVLLYHTGVDGAYEVGREAFPSKQPAEIAERLTSCPNCGRRLNSVANPATIKIEAGPE
jgi:predicted RNA-binding Zn-ribbon protein involved in translation (DUF1610 family)